MSGRHRPTQPIPTPDPSTQGPSTQASSMQTRPMRTIRVRRPGRGAAALLVAGALAAAAVAVGHSGHLWPAAAPQAPGTVPGSAAPGAPAPGASTAGPPVGTVIMVIRHGEKPDED